MKKCPLCTYQTNYDKEIKEHLEQNHQLHYNTRLVQDFLKSLTIDEEVKQEKKEEPKETKSNEELYGKSTKFTTGKKYTKRKTGKKK